MRRFSALILQQNFASSAPVKHYKVFASYSLKKILQKGTFAGLLFLIRKTFCRAKGLWNASQSLRTTP